MKPKVVLYHPVPKALLDELHTRFDLTVFEKITDSNRAEFLAAALEADGLIGMGLPIKTQELRGAKRLRVIATISTGYDSFDVAELTANNVVLLNLYDPLTETTADLAFTLIMASGRRIVELDRKVRKGEWVKHVETPWFGLDTHGKTLGIVGLGRIGAAIARRGALGCGMSILYTSRSTKPDAEMAYGARRCELDDLLRESDFVCLVVPLTAETRHLIGKRELELMKPTAILVNIARGPVVDEAALAEALRNGTIYGAGLDVYEREPLPMDSPLLCLDNVILAPHVGSATKQTRDAMAMYSGQSLIGFLCRGEARCVVNPEVLGDKR
jgi:lactate dehydrogenase-like 2-hydroxyacid dehydrogenase